MPRDVREYIIKNMLQAALDTCKTPDEKREFSTLLLSGALEHDLSDELRDRLIATAFKALDGLDQPSIGQSGI